MELCLPNCNWITNKTINLYPWDAGIDSGVTYNVYYFNNVNNIIYQYTIYFNKYYKIMQYKIDDFDIYREDIKCLIGMKY